MNEQILFQYQVKTKSQYGTRFYYFYADTDIENYLNNKNIKYVRYAKDTALNKKEKRIKELFKENKHYKHIIDELEKRIDEAIEILECSNNMFAERALQILKESDKKMDKENIFYPLNPCYGILKESEENED